MLAIGHPCAQLNPSPRLKFRVVIAVYATQLDAEDPLSGLVVGELEAPPVPEGWTTVEVRAASLNHHDLWSLRGVGLPADRLPMILGCDAAGIDADGREVVVHSVVTDDAWRGDETLDPRRSILSERFAGTFAERVAVPRRNLVAKPPELSFEEAACLPTAWLTAYRMLFTRAAAAPGSTILVQGAGGGVATALIVLARAAGLRVWATSRSELKRERAVALGADAAFEPGARLPERVDVVAETVGAATWDHSLKALKPGGTLVISGATVGRRPARRPEPDLLPAALGGRVDDGHARRARPARPALRRARRAAGDRGVDADGRRALGVRGACRRGRVRQARAHALRRVRAGNATFPGGSRRRPGGYADCIRLRRAVGQAAPVHPANTSGPVCKPQPGCGW